MLAGVPVPVAATAELATMVRAAGADELADRLEHGLADDTKLLASGAGALGAAGVVWPSGSTDRALLLVWMQFQRQRRGGHSPRLRSAVFRLGQQDDRAIGLAQI